MLTKRVLDCGIDRLLVPEVARAPVRGPTFLFGIVEAGLVEAFAGMRLARSHDKLRCPLGSHDQMNVIGSNV